MSLTQNLQLTACTCETSGSVLLYCECEDECPLNAKQGFFDGYVHIVYSIDTLCASLLVISGFWLFLFF